MKNYQDMPFHPIQEKIAEILSQQTQNTEKLFFRIVIAYFFAKLASMMRASVRIPGRGVIPINIYAINLAQSGAGKGHSINIIEDQIIHKFREHFLERTFPMIAERNLGKLSIRRANKNSTDPEDEMQALKVEFEAAGPMVFSFDSGTTAAVKQIRHKLLMAASGSINMELDEIGHNLLGNVDVLTAFLELYDLGKIKQKLVKHTRENMRSEALFGSTPANALLFGTPANLLDGAKVEEMFTTMLESGYARRCFFGMTPSKGKSASRYSPEELYDIFTDTGADNYLVELSDTLGALADPNNFETVLDMSKEVTLQWLEYTLACDRQAETFSEYDELKKAELTHRYFKVAKLAGAYAFIDQSMAINEEHLHNAIALAEQSGEAFERILNRDRPYVKLATYICNIGREVTHADLVEDLPFYKGTESQKKDMLTLAIAHGYKNNMIIKKEALDGIEFLSGKSLTETDLNSLVVSYSTDIVHSYKNDIVRFDKLHKLVTAPGHHWVNHHLQVVEEGKGGYRDEAHCKQGFNLIVLDVDDGLPMKTATLLLKDYSWLMHPTVSSTPEKNRYRIVMPISHVLDMDSSEFKTFMVNIYQWLPFQVDDQTGQRSRKWCTHPSQHLYNEGTVLEVFQFIPKTKKADEVIKKIAVQTNMTALERWFVNKMEEGNRNTMLMRYALACVDFGQDIDTVKNNVLALNEKIVNPLPETEVLSTVLVTASKRFSQRP